MPTKAFKPCSKIGCPRLTRGGYCEIHKKQIENRYEEERGTSTERGYGVIWKRWRTMIIREEPLCRECLKEGREEPATDIDHIIPRAEGGKDNRENLQPLCHRHHSEKTVKEGRWTR